ncbi:MAG TPA: hypothetical protein P5250_00220 [Bacteroidales bacterium]|nr:hypothetical protein [Bacteroidales bacterium]
MKIGNVILKIFIIVLMLMFVFTQCKKDKDIKVIITVKYQSDTNKVVPQADVLIEKYDVKVKGVTDNNGIFETTFKLEAILDVHASKDTSTVTTTPPLTGSTVIRLEEGKTIRKTVFIN